ncbi:MAG: zinc-ribbon domain containing protein [Candidatus Methylomirabilales bacterium]
MVFQDKILTCVECGKEFAFTAGEQEFFAQKGFTNEPKRCKSCKAQRKGGALSPGPREVFEAVCFQCGQRTTVPFRPMPDRPVYCRPCYQTRRAGAVRELSSS